MKILIVYYSLYGHVFKLAQAVKEGAESVKGAEVLFLAWKSSTSYSRRPLTTII